MNDHSQEHIAFESERVKVRDTPEALARLLEARGWGDGLPVVPPTPERVARMVEGSGLAPDAEIGLMPPRQGVITVEALAVNAVMRAATRRTCPFWRRRSARCSSLSSRCTPYRPRRTR